jgi:hypothetical protein
VDLLFGDIALELRQARRGVGAVEAADRDNRIAGRELQRRSAL